MVSFPHKTGCSTLPIPQMTEVSKVKEYRFCKRRKHLETLAKKKIQVTIILSWVPGFIKSIFMRQDPPDLPLFRVLGFFCSPRDMGLENWFSFSKAWESFSGRKKQMVIICCSVAWRGEEKNISKRLLVTACKSLKSYYCYYYYYTKYSKSCISKATVDWCKDPKADSKLNSHLFSLSCSWPIEGCHIR